MDLVIGQFVEKSLFARCGKILSMNLTTNLKNLITSLVFDNQIYLNLCHYQNKTLLEKCR